MKAGRIKQWILGAVAMASPVLAVAQAAAQATGTAAAAPKPWQLNMGQGVTAQSMNAYSAHMQVMWICVVIGVLVFGAMAVAMFRFRHSRGAVPDKTFTHSTKLEIVWTVIPVLVLVVLAFPAISKLIAMYDTREAKMTVKVTGYQWLWKYDYLGEGVSITSRLDRQSDAIRQSGRRPTAAEAPHYLRDVDNALVLPTNTKIRFVITADDVIHAWWVPALGWKQDAIPGIVNEAWTDIKMPGIYRGQCAELCGKDHGFMPIVVRAVPMAEYQQWLAAEKAKTAPAVVASPAALLPPSGDGNAPAQVDPQMVEDVQSGTEASAPPASAPATPTESAPQAPAPAAG